jgi:glycosyltransferase involved in cell wall biosynthesis
MNHPRNILISGSLAGGGVQTHMSQLCRVLRRCGARVTACGTSTEWPPDALAELRDLGVTVHVPIWGRWQALATWPFVLPRDFDLVYCIGQGRMHGRLKRGHLRPEGLAVYHEILDCPRPGSVADREMRHIDALIANSRRVAADMQQRWPEKPLRVVPFLTADQPVAEPPARPAADSRTVRVVYLGRLAEHKRPRMLIRNWRSMISRPPFAPARLDIHGDDVSPATLPALRREVAELGLSDDVRLHGAYAHRDLPEILAKADVVVLPSEWEGLPLVLVEAMQHGVPIVATNVGGTAELGIGNPGAIITEPDWDSFAAGLLTMIGRVRRGETDAVRLHRWCESRYGYASVAALWQLMATDPRRFFNQPGTESEATSNDAGLRNPSPTALVRT